MVLVLRLVIGVSLKQSPELVAIPENLRGKKEDGVKKTRQLPNSGILQQGHHSTGYLRDVVGSLLGIVRDVRRTASNTSLISAAAVRLRYSEQQGARKKSCLFCFSAVSPRNCSPSVKL